MTQQLTERDVRDIATYARIGLTDEELAQMTVDLNSIIETLKPITEFDLEGVDDSLVPADSIEFDKDEVKKNLEFLPMSNLSQVLNAALLKPKAAATHPRTKKSTKAADAAAMTAWLGSQNSFYKIAVTALIDGQPIAASLQWDGSSRACLYFSGSSSHVLGLSDAEHDSLVKKAAGQ